MVTERQAMQDDMYSDAPAGDAAPEAESKSSDTPTAVLPKDFFHDDVQPGKVCEVKVERVFDDQIEVSYVGHEAAEEQPNMAEAPMPSMGAEME